MRVTALVLVLSLLGGSAAAQSEVVSVAVAGESCWRAGARLTTPCVRQVTAALSRGEVEKPQLIRILRSGSGGAAGNALSELLVTLATGYDLDEVEQEAFIALAMTVEGDRNRERALFHLSARQPLSPYNVVGLLEATRRIEAPRLRGSLLTHIARTQSLDAIALQALRSGRQP